jgi:hypothetical protein
MYTLTCSEPWQGTTCPGTLASIEQPSSPADPVYTLSEVSALAAALALVLISGFAIRKIRRMIDPT